MKVLLCAPYKSYYAGGISKWTEHIVKYYQSNTENDLWMDIFSSARENKVYADTPLFKRILYGFAEYTPLLKKYRKKIYSGKYDVVHITSSASLGLIRDILMLRITRENQTKSILHFHFGRIPELYKKNNWEKKLLDKTIRMADEIIVIDQSSFNTLINQGCKNIKLLPNPLGPDVEEIIKNSSIKR
ncbi:MAG TPA: glycosyltransferase family 4 protein, partial [Gallicola sp.]|nr:glycosyltransferase family 4 protein [Gallicola sp.]